MTVPAGNVVQASAGAWLLSAITGATVKAVLVDTDYSYDAAHDFLDDVPSGARVATVTLGTSATGFGLYPTGDATFTAVSNPQDIEGLWLYIDAGSDATRRLLAFYVRRADGTDFTLTPSGDDLVAHWVGPLFTI